MRATLDTNCFIDAVNVSSPNHCAARELFALRERGRVELYVSKHTISELEGRNDAALSLARQLPEIPYYPIGTWDDLVGTWDEVSGTWNDARKNQGIQEELRTLAKSGTTIRD